MKPTDTERIEVLMKERGITAVDLAKIVGLTANGLRIAIREHGGFRLSQLIKMAQYFNIDPRDLISTVYLEDKGLSKKEFINNRLNLIFKELATTISMVVEDSENEDRNGCKTLEYVRLSSALERVLSNPNPYPAHKEELTNILNETQEAYKKSGDAREKELLKYLKEKIKKAKDELNEENKKIKK